MLNSYTDILDHFDPSLTQEDVWASGTLLFEKFGSCWLTAGVVSRDDPVKPVIRTSAPSALMACYFAEQLNKVDPWLQHCMKSTEVISMDVLAIRCALSRTPEQRLANMFGAFGVHRVAVIPAYSRAYAGGLALYAPDRDRAQHLLHEIGRSDLRLAASVFANAYCPNDDRSPTHEIYDLRRVLSPRERETLCWLASGLDTGQIAHRMGVAPVSVTKNLASIRRKLGASTREQALVTAIRLGLIDP